MNKPILDIYSHFWIFFLTRQVKYQTLPKTTGSNKATTILGVIGNPMSGAACSAS